MIFLNGTLSASEEEIKENPLVIKNIVGEEFVAKSLLDKIDKGDIILSENTLNNFNKIFNKLKISGVENYDTV